VPIIGYVDLLSRFAVAGWAADTERLGEPVEISLVVNGQEAARVVANRPRDGLQLGDPPSIYHGFSLNFVPPLSAEQAQHIIVCDRKTSKPLPNGEALLRARDSEDGLRSPSRVTDSKVRPLLLTAFARTGTTVIMKRLGTHPKIAVAGSHPYEFRVLAYYAAALMILTSPADRERSTKPDGLGGDLYFIGRNPFFDGTNIGLFEGPDALNRCFHDRGKAVLQPAFRELIRGFYELPANQQGKPDFTYFAEKCDINTTTRATAREIFPELREILLVRDLRDVLCSYRDFFKSDWKPDAILKGYADRALEIYRRRGPETLFIRYEDFMQHEEDTLAAVADALGLEPFAKPDGFDETELFSIHGTSRSPLHSIGRWRTDLVREEQEACNRQFEAFLTTFGYSFD
jgi:hypothetical protein